MEKRIVWTAFLIFSSLPAERMKVIPPMMMYTKQRIVAVMSARATNVATISMIEAFSSKSLSMRVGGGITMQTAHENHPVVQEFSD